MTRVFKVATWSLLASVVVALLVILTAAIAQGILLINVMTPSMTAAGLPVGTAVVAVPVSGSEIRPGQFIFAKSPYGDDVLHVAVSKPKKDRNGHLQLTMKGASNPGTDAYTYDVTNGAHRVVWSMQGLGSVVQVANSAVPGTEQITLPGSSLRGVSWVAVVVAAIVLLAVLWVFWPSKRNEAPAGAETESANSEECNTRWGTSAPPSRKHHERAAT